MPETYVFPTSSAQQRLWFLDQLVPGNSFYNINLSIPFRFLVSPEVVRSALNEIARRHEALRTTFAVEEGLPVQVITGGPIHRWRVVDLRHLPPSERETETLRIATEQAHEPFDLARGPLLRAALLTRGAADHLFAVTIHHIIADAWSIGVLIRELGDLYKAFAEGRPSPLPELEVQYADFAVWQAEYLRGKLFQEQVNYWRERLVACPTLQLPTDRPRPAMPSFRGESHVFELDAGMVARVKALSRDEGCTPFMTLLAAFFVLLRKYSGQDDLVVGVPVANRNQTELEPLIGFFVNTLVLRADTSGDPTPRAFLARLREIALGAYAHQDLPFERLVDEIQLERDLSRNPLFQVTFQLHNEPGLVAPSGPGEDRGVDIQRGTSNFDLVFDLWETGAGMTARIDFATELFDAETISRMGRHYRHYLQGMLDCPDEPISSISAMPPGERHQVLFEWNAHAFAPSGDGCIHHLFEARVDRDPEAEAVRFLGESLNYGELDRRANQVARGLLRLGVEADSPVAVCMRRSAELVVGLLGILKAGGAYIGLDPADPPGRIARMLRDADCRVVLTQSPLLGHLADSGSDLIALDADPPAFASESTDRLAEDVGSTTGDGLAYIAFTSGSTGDPKGVCVGHRAVVCLVNDAAHFTIGPGDVVLQVAPIPFDASTFEIWAPLLNGAALVVAPPDQLSLEELGSAIAREGITTLFLTTGLFHQMADAQPGSLRGVRRLLIGGDVASPRHVRAALEGGLRWLLNCYGPTECTTFATCHILERASRADGPVPIGRPVAGRRAYVLDDRGAPVPVGVPGELYVGGEGLARGYLNRPEQTAAAFVPSPLPDIPDRRLYRTGDRVRWRADGTLDFLGRADRQVKVRGFRIEPADIEIAIGRHPSIREAVVQAVPDASGDKRLVAYVAASPGEAPSAGSLRQFLRRDLPAFMIPSEFHILDAIPLNANGKVDTRSLPEASAEEVERRGAYVPPTTDVERALEPLWRDVLGLDRIGVHDNFFSDLRGHSLLATQLVSRIRNELDVELPLRSLFEAPDLARLAVVVEDLLLAEIEGLRDEREIPGLTPEGLDHD